MKIFISVLTAAALVAAAAISPAMAAPVCLTSQLIDHTAVQDTKTILFYMKNGEVYANELRAACPGLNFHGFEINLRGGNDAICSNQEALTVTVTHEVCMMGAFTPYKARSTNHPP
jgi:hypothetical protein